MQWSEIFLKLRKQAMWSKYAGVWEGVLDGNVICLNLNENGTYTTIGFPRDIGFSRESKQQDWAFIFSRDDSLNLYQKFYFETDEDIHQVWVVSCVKTPGRHNAHRDSYYKQCLKVENERAGLFKMMLFVDGREIFLERKQEIATNSMEEPPDVDRLKRFDSLEASLPGPFSTEEMFHRAMNGRWETIVDGRSAYIYFSDKNYTTDIAPGYFRFPLLLENEPEGEYAMDFHYPWHFENRAGAFKVEVRVKNKNGELVYGRPERGKKRNVILKSEKEIYEALRASGELILQIGDKKLSFKRPENGKTKTKYFPRN